jgi:hypothetical protein
MLIHPSSGACDLFIELFYGLYCCGTMRVGVMSWFGWGDVVFGCRLKNFSKRSSYITLKNEILEALNNKSTVGDTFVTFKRLLILSVTTYFSLSWPTME